MLPRYLGDPIPKFDVMSLDKALSFDVDPFQDMSVHSDQIGPVNVHRRTPNYVSVGLVAGIETLELKCHSHPAHEKFNAGNSHSAHDLNQGIKASVSVLAMSLGRAARMVLSSGGYLFRH